MKYEILGFEIFEKNNRDYSLCEDKWNPIEEETVYDLIEAAKKVFYYKKDIPADYFDKDISEERMAKGKLTCLPIGYIRERNNNPKCPLCGCSFKKGTYSISRRDNSTEICPECGLRESIEDYTNIREL